jgi:fused signal recognition particle receptor
MFYFFSKTTLVKTGNEFGEMKMAFLKTEQGIKRSRETWFGKIARLFDRDTVGEEVWQELEELLILADVGVNTTQKLIQEVGQKTKAEKLTQGSEVRLALKREMVKMLTIDTEGKLATPRKGVHIILVVGVNGSGKTTSIAKLAYNFHKEGKKTILAAADTFRAAAIDQLKRWGERVDAEVIAHKPGGDPGAVVFDALQAAQARQVPVVIVDTAGRLHTKFNLMEELKKIKRVIARSVPDYYEQVLLVIDATTGQNGLAQAKYFTEAVGISGIFLAKLDGTAKGGIVLAICDELRIPITYIGTGEGLEDIVPFDAETFVEAILA